MLVSLPAWYIHSKLLLYQLLNVLKDLKNTSLVWGTCIFVTLPRSYLQLSFRFISVYPFYRIHIFLFFYFLFHEDSHVTDMDILRCTEMLHCLSKNRLYTKMLRIHLFSFLTIKTPRVLDAIAPLRIYGIVLVVLYCFMMNGDICMSNSSSWCRL